MGRPFPEDALFLGFDSSTQSLKATALDSRLAIVASEIVHFASDLPHYKTSDGVYRDPSGGGRIVSPNVDVGRSSGAPPREAEERELRILESGGRLRQRAAARQRLLEEGSSAILASLDPQSGLLLQLSEAFSTKESPIWMDSSTTSQCREIEKAVGGALEVSTLTGSRAYERFTGPQIRKIFETQQDVYDDTERISLVSSFMASILIGGYAPIDETDGAGMNLMDLKERAWSKIALEATAPGLEEKLGKLALPTPSPEFHFKKSCLVIQWSGDNPNSLAGLTLNSPGDLAISLGTSDTIFGITDHPQPRLEGHVFPNPVDSSGYMVMLCYKNGSLTREVRRGSWDVFSEYLERRPRKAGIYYKEHEILPPLPVGYHRYTVDVDSATEREVDRFDAPSEVRAIVEGQLLSIRAHSERFGLPVPPRRIVATGGASANRSILRVMAAVFGCAVYTVQRPDSASLGAALRAAHGWLCERKAGDGALPEAGRAGRRGWRLRAYGELMRRRMEIERRLVEKLGRQ
ncbi:unnamed protein product [Spirodela intermedia]|uniref:Xylulose kinase n=1 Tax=Spirodela intermedia TaxID=51605 RepID=A0A7I8I7D9_SPIIN|nr:unnamed protein product [Spirodela intermedia]CAA6653497.1 unnamed protein product [Spirodela intermedia]